MALNHTIGSNRQFEVSLLVREEDICLQLLTLVEGPDGQLHHALTNKYVNSVQKMQGTLCW